MWRINHKLGKLLTGLRGKKGSTRVKNEKKVASKNLEC